MKATKRTYTDRETGSVYDLFLDQTDNFRLFKGDTEVQRFYLCAHTDTTIKLNNNKKIDLFRGEFYNLKDGEIVVSRKFAGFKRFVKL